MRRPRQNHSAAFKARMAIADDGKEQIRELREKVGQLTMESSFLEQALGKFPPLSAKR